KDVQSLTIPVKNSYQNINTNNDGSALDIDKQKNKEAIKKFLDDDN
ncbi:MAG: LytR family transcriptional regulator, partial [Staphylococcus lugdunensis]|nr:LytR family transcriptional regulator [Staphylococcus lugdunensis]